MKMRIGLPLTAAVAVCAGVATAAINPIDEFTGDYFEGYETQPHGQFLPSYDVFAPTDSVVRQLGAGQGLHITSGWSFFYVIYPHGGNYFMGGAGVNAEYVFDVPAKKFGGFFGTNADVPDFVATFYDEDGNTLGELPGGAPLGNWKWNGWETDGAGIKTVQIVANNQYHGFIMMDDLQYTPIPGPGALALLALGGLLRRRRR